MGQVFNEQPHAGGFILSEGNGYISRENATLNAGQNLEAGTVLGQILLAAPAVAGPNTGNGTVTLGAIGPDAQVGFYRLDCIATSSDAGTFNLYAPDGTLVRQITVGGGATVNEHVTVTIADGSADFVAGDSFTFEVSGDAYEQLDPAAPTGEQSAAAILYAAIDATDADTACCVIARNAEVNGNELIWPDGISDSNKAAAMAALKAHGILIR